MKKVIFLTISILNGFCCFSQNDFILNSDIDFTTVKINGKQYQVDSGGIEIKTNYPRFDTLTFLENAANVNIPIICNFKPDTVYSIILSCCGSFDIIPTSKLKYDSLFHWDFGIDVDKIQNKLMDKPFISIRTIDNPKDSIYAWQVDYASSPHPKQINSTLWRLGIPHKGAYWSNITKIEFFKTKVNTIQLENSDMEEFLQIKNIQVLSSISFRLFDNERFVIIFDEKSNSITLEYE